ncbi:MAG TPA: carbamoyltransferase HypF [Jatrophihabitans sp.]|nr:carbamoyltransferase HypF [Jatrophihabitans sp.]
MRGLVQGVGFRPFVYALARECGLSGEVGNTGDGVLIEIEGPGSAITGFAGLLLTRAPPLARIDDIGTVEIPSRGGTDFVIRDSQPTAGRTLVSPDVATCADCLDELGDPANRRYRHPFISCTNCGPRFTIVTALPYDRPGTTMAELPLCGSCAAEYADPSDRRFHAQTVACPDCGPTLTLHRPLEPAQRGGAAISETRRLLAAGAIVAVKGLGGYHLACDATDEPTVATLRKRKDRGDKPFAVMVADLDTARQIAELSAGEAALLTDPRRPVVLLTRRAGSDPALAASVAPGRRDVGVMLAYTPVHHLLFGLPGDAPGPRMLVMTSGNLAGEPIAFDDQQARTRLAGLADAWLGHDRRIQVPCDDSVVRVAAGVELPVRRSRGYAPLPVALPLPVRPALAVGGDLKNTFCVADGGYAWLSAHVGDMDDLATLQAFERATTQLQAITGVRPELIVADRHPGYRSSAWAAKAADRLAASGTAGDGSALRRVQHHHAHIASAMAENGHDGAEPVIGFAFDGTGYGADGAVWGGEVLIADYDDYQRATHLRYSWLPGGDAGVRNPCRMALSHLHSAGVEWDPALPSVTACSPAERSVLARQLQTGLGCSRTSSMGRLFDAVSSLAGVCHRVAYEAEAAMLFEALAGEAISGCDRRYAFGLTGDDGTLQADPRPVIAAVAADVLAGTGAPLIAARFHLAVVDLVAGLAAALRARTGLATVALSGGVFLNVVLTSLCVQRLQDNGFRVLRHRLVPPSDAGLALGQIAIAARIRASSASATKSSTSLTK